MIEQFKTIEGTNQFLKGLPENYRNNIFEAMKNLSLNLERPNMTAEDKKNMELAFLTLKNNGMLTLQNISNLNDVIYQKESIEIDGIIFDRNNLSGGYGVYKKETDERYYNEIEMEKTLQKQRKKTFTRNDVYKLLAENGLIYGSKYFSYEGWNVLGIILGCKKSGGISKKLFEVGQKGYLRLKSNSDNIVESLYVFDKLSGTTNIIDGDDNDKLRLPVRPILGYNKKIIEKTPKVEEQKNNETFKSSFLIAKSDGPCPDTGSDSPFSGIGFGGND